MSKQNMKIMSNNYVFYDMTSDVIGCGIKTILLDIRRVLRNY